MFTGVSTEVLTLIASLLIERRFPKHKTIVEEGAPGDYMYIISEGRVKVTKLSGDGREKILELLEVGDFFGEMSLFDEAPRSASVKAMSDVRILALARNDFLRLLSRSPDLALSVIQELTRRLRQVDEQASSLSFQRVKERTMGLLVRLAKDASSHEGRRKTPVLTHQQIADMIGTSRETVTRAVKGLKEEGWLEQEGKHYLVPAED
jgi:CRP-like cAMP-binding protein